MTDSAPIPLTRQAGSLHVLQDIPLTVPEKPLLRLLKLPRLTRVDDIPEEQLRQDIQHAIRRARELARPSATVRWVALDSHEAAAPPVVSQLLAGDNVGLWLEGCVRATFVSVTLGHAIDREIESLADSAVAEAYHLDAVASVMVDAVADAVDEDVCAAIRAAGYVPQRRKSPGYGDYPLDVQPAVLGWTSAGRIGVTCSPQFILEPSKSVTAFVGWRAPDEREARLP